MLLDLFRCCYSCCFGVAKNVLDAKKLVKEQKRNWQKSFRTRRYSVTTYNSFTKKKLQTFFLGNRSVHIQQEKNQKNKKLCIFIKKTVDFKQNPHPTLLNVKLS